jgi:hypothetical protein
MDEAWCGVGWSPGGFEAELIEGGGPGMDSGRTKVAVGEAVSFMEMFSEAKRVGFDSEDFLPFLLFFSSLIAKPELSVVVGTLLDDSSMEEETETWDES